VVITCHHALDASQIKLHLHKAILPIKKEQTIGCSLQNAFSGGI